MHAVHLSGKSIRAARYGDPVVCFLCWEVGSKWRPPDNKSTLLPAKIKFVLESMRNIFFLSKVVGINPLVFTISSKIIYLGLHPNSLSFFFFWFNTVCIVSEIDWSFDWLSLTQHSARQVFRHKRMFYLQWALPSSGHPCPWLPPPSSSWGIGHLCPVWWQRGNCLTAHTTDTHTCFIHAFGLSWRDS